MENSSHPQKQSERKQLDYNAWVKAYVDSLEVGYDIRKISPGEIKLVYYLIYVFGILMRYLLHISIKNRVTCPLAYQTPPHRFDPWTSLGDRSPYHFICLPFKPLGWC